jgi:hypothetical protein
MGSMETDKRPIRPEVAKQIRTCDPMVSDDWTQISARIPVEVEALAWETKALQRRREVRSPLDLLRMVLAYSVCDWSLRMVGAWATTIGLGRLSDVAIRKRLRNTLPFVLQFHLKDGRTKSLTYASGGGNPTFLSLNGESLIEETGIEVELTTHEDVEWERNLQGLLAFLEWTSPSSR